MVNSYAAEHELMVREQIASRGVADAAVLAALRKVERHRFVRESYFQSACTDKILADGEPVLNVSKDRLRAGCSGF